MDAGFQGQFERPAGCTRHTERIAAGFFQHQPILTRAVCYHSLLLCSRLEEFDEVGRTIGRLLVTLSVTLVGLLSQGYASHLPAKPEQQSNSEQG